jgi:hypothetical protein
MILKLHLDVSYLLELGACSCSDGFFILVNRDSPDPLTQGPLLVSTAIMKNVLLLAAEAEIGALFDNTKKAVALQTILAKMQYPQPATLVQTDNSMACGIANSNLRQQHLRAMDMRFLLDLGLGSTGAFPYLLGAGAAQFGGLFYKTSLCTPSSVHAVSLCGALHSHCHRFCSVCAARC